MRELLRGYALAAAESAGEAERFEAMLQELEAFSAALTRHEPLRRALDDPGIPAATRRAVVQDLLEDRATPEALGLLSFTVRVEPAAELPIVLAQLIALLIPPPARSRRRSLREEPLPEVGRLGTRERLRGYAERVLQELTESREVDEVEDELFRFARILDSSPELRAVLGDPAAALTGRLAVLDDLLEGKVRPATLRLARFVLASGHHRDLVATFEHLAELAAEERGRRLAEVRSAVELDEQERTRLAAALGRLVERPVDLRVILDPEVVGGALVSVGDLIIDGTVRMRLERLRDALAKSS